MYNKKKQILIKGEMADWKKLLKYDPLKPLSVSVNEAIVYFTKRDLLKENPDKIDFERIKEVNRIFSRQNEEGYWGKSKNLDYPPERQKLLETFKNLRILVKKYQLTNYSKKIAQASEYVFKWQTSEGDFRGFIGDQYATYYTGEILSILIKAGYQEDQRTYRGLEWLLSKRQKDGGWTVPLLTHTLDQETKYRSTSEPWKTYEPDFTKPFSHNWTDMALRAFASHPKYQKNKVLKAASLLKTSFFKPDNYRSYQDGEYWIRFLFWWPNIVTSLDSLSRLEFKLNDRYIMKAVNWLSENQLPNGLWKSSYKKGDRIKDDSKEVERQIWLTYEICLILKRLCG